MKTVYTDAEYTLKAPCLTSVPASFGYAAHYLKVPECEQIYTYAICGGGVDGLRSTCRMEKASVVLNMPVQEMIKEKDCRCW